MVDLQVKSKSGILSLYLIRYIANPISAAQVVVRPILEGIQ